MVAVAGTRVITERSSQIKTDKVILRQKSDIEITHRILCILGMLVGIGNGDKCRQVVEVIYPPNGRIELIDPDLFHVDPEVAIRIRAPA